MLKMTIIKETRKSEKRVAITPYVVKKLHHLGIKVFIESDAGLLSDFDNIEYQRACAEISTDKIKLYENTDIICWFKRPKDDISEIKYIPKLATLIGFLDPLKPGKHIEHYLSEGRTCFS